MTKETLVYIIYCIFLYCLMTDFNDGSSIKPNIISKVDDKSKRLIISYCSWGQMDEKIIKAAEDGSNIIIWFSINLINKDGNPFIDSCRLDSVIVKKRMEEIKNKGLDVKHLISIGGWNSPHIDESFTAEDWKDTILTWNKEFNFDGIDFDLEGNDDIQSVYNQFTYTQLDLIGKIAFELKRTRSDFIVSIAPSQSYLDYESNEFSLKLNFTPSWRDEEFPYHGSNCMGYVIWKYNQHFDFISIQLYEGWSRANNKITYEYKDNIEKYFYDLVNKMNNGWIIKINNENINVKVDKEKLVIGLANGWAGPNRGDKFMLLFPNEIDSILQYLINKQSLPKGFMFWTISEEGKDVKDMNGNIVKFSFVKSIKDVYDRNGINS